MNPGLLYAALAYVIWGVFPLYFKQMQGVPPVEILAHRIAWSLVCVIAMLAALRRWRWIAQSVAQPRVVLGFVGSAAVISINWGVYIAAVNQGRVVDSSLGYFINPLVNVLIGAFVLHERLRRGQWAAIAIAALGVAWLTVVAGRPPWIGLVLAVSFATYGLLRKTSSLGAIEGFSLEVLLLAPFALAYLAWLAHTGQSAFVDGSGAVRWWLASAGPMTAVPLLLFAAGARRLRFSTLGLL